MALPFVDLHLHLSRYCGQTSHDELALTLCRRTASHTTARGGRTARAWLRPFGRACRPSRRPATHIQFSLAARADSLTNRPASRPLETYPLRPLSRGMTEARAWKREMNDYGLRRTVTTTPLPFRDLGF